MSLFDDPQTSGKYVTERMSTNVGALVEVVVTVCEV